MRYRDPAWVATRPSTLTDPTTMGLIVCGQNVALPAWLLTQTSSIIKDAVLARDAADRGNIMGVVHNAIKSKDSFDVVFNCLIHGFVDFHSIKQYGFNLDNVVYQDVGKLRVDHHTTCSHLDIYLVIDSMILAHIIRADSIVKIIKEVLQYEFQNCIMSLRQIDGVLTAGEITHDFLKQWVFEWDGEGLKTVAAVKKHDDRVKEAMKKSPGFAEVVKEAAKGQSAANRMAKVVKTILRDEKETGVHQRRGRSKGKADVMADVMADVKPAANVNQDGKATATKDSAKKGPAASKAQPQRPADVEFKRKTGESRGRVREVKVPKRFA